MHLAYANPLLPEGRCIAMRVGAQAWGRVDDWWNHVTWLRGSSLSSFPYIRSGKVDDWHKFFMPLVQQAMPRGAFWFGERRSPMPVVLSPSSACSDARVFHETTFWGRVWPTRMMSPHASGRVKMWRKRARNGELPPVILFYCSLLESYIIMDGHDRLLAATLEDQRPAFLFASHVRMPRPRDLAWQPAFREALAHSYSVANVAAFSKETLDTFNRQAVEAWGPGRAGFVTRFAPMNIVEWRDQVMAAGKGEDIGELIYGLRDLS